MNVKICGLTVTYGDRWHFLERGILSARSNGFHHLHIVLNGVSARVKQNVDNLTASDSFFSYSFLDKNEGSAGGFGEALAFAVRGEFDRYIIIDDDNLISFNSLLALETAYQEFFVELNMNFDSMAVVGFRETHQRHEVFRSKKEICMASNNFLGFHVKDICRKIFRRLGIGLLKKNREFTPDKTKLSVRTAAWSGFYFHPDVIKKYGLPIREFYLYGDDVEYTRRITRDGGSIWLVRDAVVEEMDISWATESQSGSSFMTLLNGVKNNSVRVKYMIRNQSYIDFRLESSFKLVVFFNCVMYCFILLLAGLFSGKIRAALNCISAVSDGIAGRLGQY